MHRHNNTSGACQENQSAPNAQVLEGIFDNPFLTPREAFVKDYLNSYQRYTRPDSRHARSSRTAGSAAAARIAVLRSGRTGAGHVARRVSRPVSLSTCSAIGRR